jgi:hypothetical protein
MPEKRSFIARMRGNASDGGEKDARWQRRARTRNARIALAEDPAKVTDLAPPAGTGSASRA